MGCVFGKDLSNSRPNSSGVVAVRERDRVVESDLSILVGRREKVVVENGEGREGDGNVHNGGDQERKEGSVRGHGERRRKANPRLSNPPKNVHGEQVAAGCPSWLSAVLGEAINGWTPRRADTFEKIDKVEQLHKIFKLCGSPSEEYWKKSKLPHATIFRPQHSYKRCIADTFKDFPASSLPLIETLLSIDPAERQTATAALISEFFATEPYACDPSSLPKYPPSKEMDAKLRDEEARRLRATGKPNADGAKKTRTRDRAARAVPAPGANAELQANLDRRRQITHANAKSKSEKFPPPHQDATLGYPLGSSHNNDPAFDPPDVPFSYMNFSYAKAPMQTWSGPLQDPGGGGDPRRSKPSKKDSQRSRSSARTRH